MTKPTLKQRLDKLKQSLKALMEDYGPIALGTWFAIFGLVLVGFATAIRMGVSVESGKGEAGIWAAAYVATRLTSPLRIAATLVLTPLVAKLIRRGKKVSPPPQNPSTGKPSEGASEGH